LPSETGVLCMAYGNPRTEGDIEAYFTHIRGGRPPSPAALEELRGRYRAVGGSPLEEITCPCHDARVRYDGRGTAWLVRRGFRVLRFAADDVLSRSDDISPCTCTTTFSFDCASPPRDAIMTGDPRS